MFDLTLQILPDGVSCFRRDKNDWRLCRLEGENSLPLTESAQSVLDMLRKELHDEATLAACNLQLVYANESRSRDWMTRMLAVALPAGFAHVQVLALEPLLARLAQADSGAPESASPDQQWRLDYLLPLLDQLWSSPISGPVALQEERTLLENESRALSLRNAELGLLVQQLQQQLSRQTQEHQGEMRELLAQQTHPGKPPMAELVFFMPLFYRHFWEKVRADELAQLLREHEVPVIRSPFREPGSGTLMVMRKRFLELPLPVREAVRAFANDLAEHLDVRPDSLNLLEPQP